MAGKRPRQIQRTTSMSQLGFCGAGGVIAVTTGTRIYHSSPAAGDSENFNGDAAHIGFFKQEDAHLLESMEVCTAAEVGAPQITAPAPFLEDKPMSMAIDDSEEESLFASHAVRPEVHPPIIQPFEKKPVALHSSLYRDRGAAGSLRRAHFLDVCFHCLKRLGHGRDVFIYRGDRAFCSAECRHFQIVADERREKCGLTVVKEDTSASDSNNTVHVETAAA